MRGSEADLFEPAAEPAPPETPPSSFNVPAKFVELARSAILHRDPERFAILYRLLWRLLSQHDLLQRDRSRRRIGLRRWQPYIAIEHKMQSFVRFREIGREQTSAFRRLV